MAALSPFLEAFSAPSDAAAAAPQGVGALLAEMPYRFLPDKAEGVDVVFQFELSGPGGGTWHAVIQNKQCTVAEGAHPSPTTTIRMGAEDFTALLRGRLNAMAAYTSGKLKIGGDLMKSQLIQKLFRF
jgi:putative sterol carrier protein